ncbi:zinc metalloproteinase-disintegrin-like crotastatin [Puntigrus tetrazona]|uniref:zinc metalloproteinase-disintegrin-like crotastatin n=1 Tax=Puntigrus tetrazona TaxID=1606681 RepID=UPI001C8A8D68|nr:zinc metalloproteinase-disintegrin-like crotastatin [Puntigrus tetrazona]
MPTSAFTTHVLCCLCLWGCVAESMHTLPHVERFDVVRPKRQSVGKVQSDKSPQSHETYPDRLAYKLFFGGKNHVIRLEKNKQLIGHNYTEIYYQDDGLIVSSNPYLKDNCYYHGHVQDLEDSSVSVGICSGIRGFFRVKQQVYLIEPLTNQSDGDHALYKREHLRQKRRSHGEPSAAVYDRERPVAVPLKSSRWKTKQFHTTRYVELFLVVDNTEYRNFESNMDIIRARMLEVANHVDKLYRTHNIRVMLVGLEIWTKHDQIVVSVSSDDTLSRFIEWRKSDLLKRVRHDNAQFVTGIDFLGDTVGLANKYAMCAESSAGVNQDHNQNSLGLASTVAHEMGHNMGMSHDEDKCICGSFNSICIMTERVGTLFPDLFSDCSLEQLSVFLDNANPSCLLDTPSSSRLYSGSVCGNAFLDPEEECDCGTVEECKNPCCDPTTCRLTEGSQCAHGECCENCRIKDAESLCRVPENECDVPEYCTGLSEHCPENDFKMNGIPCSSGQGYCYDGQCPTHLQHCKRLWGTGAKVAADACFVQNTLGRKDSHCGKTKGGYRACAKQNMFCGKIFCDGGNDYPITGQKGVIVTVRGFCNIAGDQSEEDALSMVPTGTKCGDNKVCYDYMCQDLNVYGSSDDCSLQCNGRGICNHKNQCHCEPGWAPPYCEVRYSQLASRQAKIIGTSVAVGIALLVLALCGALFYCKRRKAVVSHKTKTPSAGHLNLHFQNNGAKRDHPEISQPIFMGTTVTQPCTPLTARLGPTRPAPPPPEKPPSQSLQTPLKQEIKPNLPPVPPVKPSLPTRSWRTDEVKGHAVFLRR